MRILAFDQSSRISGWSVFDDTALVDHGIFSLSNPNLGLRLIQIRQKVKELIDKYNPDKVIIEDIQLQQGPVNNVETFKILAEVFGNIYELVSELKLPNEAILAGTWRKGLGVAGRKRAEQKENAQKWVYDMYQIRATEDEADAICIGAYAAGVRCEKQKIEKAPVFDWS